MPEARQNDSKLAEILEKRHAGRLERIYPELLHHFSEGDVPEKTVEFGFKLVLDSAYHEHPDVQGILVEIVQVPTERFPSEGTIPAAR